MLDYMGEIPVQWARRLCHLSLESADFLPQLAVHEQMAFCEKMEKHLKGDC